jgi:hypothetical protein
MVAMFVMVAVQRPSTWKRRAPGSVRPWGAFSLWTWRAGPVARVSGRLSTLVPGCP